MKLLDRTHPFYAPLWRRVAIVAITLSWAGFEFVAGSAIWGWLMLAISLYCIYELFVAFGSDDGAGATSGDEGSGDDA